MAQAQHWKKNTVRGCSEHTTRATLAYVYICMQLQGGWLDLAGRLAVVDCPATHSCFLPVRPDLNLDLHLNLDLDLDLDLNWDP